MKEYILNDLKAFEKKWKMRNITPIKVSEEASNGSSIHVDLKTSLFKAVKNSLSIKKNGIKSIRRVVKHSHFFRMCSFHYGELTK